MKIAFAYWDERIAPVFDTARKIRIVEIVSGRTIRQIDETLPEGLFVEKALRLVELGINTLVCGAISRPFHGAISAYGIQVVSFVAGELDKVIGAWISGSLMHGAFTMPGCRRRGAGRCRATQGAGRGRNGFPKIGHKIESRQSGQRRRNGRKGGQRMS